MISGSEAVTSDPRRIHSTMIHNSWLCIHHDEHHLSHAEIGCQATVPVNCNPTWNCSLYLPVHQAVYLAMAMAAT